MSFWGTAAQVVAGAAATVGSGGNVGVGVAAAGAVGGLVSDGGGSSDCPPRTSDVGFVLQNISAADRAAWLAFNPTTGGRAGGRWNQAIDTNNINLLSSYVVGEGDCKLAADEKLLVQYFDALVAKYRRALGAPATPVYVTPTTSGSNVRDALDQIGQDVLQTGKNILGGAVQGAAGASGSAASASGRSAAFAGIDPLWLLAGVAVVGAVIFVSRK